MPSNAKPNLTPKLRFPEFRNGPEWEDARLGKLGKLVAGLTYSPDDVRDKGLLVLRSSNIQNDRIDLNDRVFVDSSIKGANLSVPNDILICVRNGSKTLIGKNALIPAGLPVCTHGAFMTVFRSPAAPFIFQLFQTPAYQKQVEADLGATINSINGSQLLRYRFSIPEQEEQKKITLFLASLDELIGAESQKLDALKSHKKGLMQQLFPREGETLPRICFPKFKTTSKWVAKALGEIATFSSGGTPSKDNPKYWNGDIPWISASSMYDWQVSEADHYVTALAIGNGTRIAQKGSLLILVRGSMLFNRVPICIAMRDVAFNQDVKALEIHASVNSIFLFYQLSAKESQIAINETGIGAGKIELDDLKGLEIYVPSVVEQQHIASCLSSLDDEINAQSSKLGVLKTHKKALMQQLFATL